jgi:hypothetical protein
MKLLILADACLIYLIALSLYGHTEARTYFKECLEESDG